MKKLEIQSVGNKIIERRQLPMEGSKFLNSVLNYSWKRKMIKRTTKEKAVKLEQTIIPKLWSGEKGKNK